VIYSIEADLPGVAHGIKKIEFQKKNISDFKGEK